MNSETQLDRRTLVTRHNVRLNEANLLSPLSVGNGRFCFTADVTGLQTYHPDYAKGMPLCTMSDWAWHSFPNTHDAKLEDTFVQVTAGGRVAPYPINMQHPSATWLRANPHQFSLGQIGLILRRGDGTLAQLGDLHKIDQQLDLWAGLISSRFDFDGHPVQVQTVAHPQLDAVAVRIESPLLSSGRLGVFIAFAYPSDQWGRSCNDWTKPDRHRTGIAEGDDRQVQIVRTIDDMRYGCALVCEPPVGLSQVEPHRLEITPAAGAGVLDVVVTFSQTTPAVHCADDFDSVRASAERAMADYWTSGGAIDLSLSTDDRWRELERRIVLSQYLTGIQSRGACPPQETGLTCNSWFGKFHLEMHWWHSAHFALWGRDDVLEKQLAWYHKVMPLMRENARRQGYAGVRWGKMVGPDGRESTSPIGPLLIWQQPHPIYYAELLHRAHPDRQTLEKHQDIVFETAEFMASFAAWSEDRRCFELGPPLITAREFQGGQYARMKNPVFETVYWWWGLNTANCWRRRLGLPREQHWDRIASSLAPLATQDGVYVERETPPTPDGGHPTMLAALGVLPKSPLLDEPTMLRTIQHVLRCWPREDTWGWDYPMMAMTAARLGRADWAIESLLLDTRKNTYLPNGHNYQAERLPLYLPGNGGLLTAAAMMAAGWDHCPDRPAPGFGADGRWIVRFEGLRPMP